MTSSTPGKSDENAPRRKTSASKPSWLKRKQNAGPEYFRIRKLMDSLQLSTICKEAHCPNQAECWNARTATFLILGDRCTRNCTFCNVGHSPQNTFDADEPRRLVDAVVAIQLRHVVITSVDRDDLPDGGASVFVECVRRLKELEDPPAVELLIPDFLEKDGCLQKVLESRPDVCGHNLETIAGLYETVRPRADYEFSREVLRSIARFEPSIISKTGIMLGLGESETEVIAMMEQIAADGVQIFTMGQYLQPSPKHHPVDRFYSPEEFEKLAGIGREIGIPWVQAGPLVRSSYHAAQQHQALL